MIINGTTLKTSSSMAGRMTSRNSSFCLMLEQISSPGGVLSISTSEYDQKQCASRQTISTVNSRTTDRAPSNRPGGPGALTTEDVRAPGRARRKAVSATVTAASHDDRWTLTASTNGRSRQRLGDLWRAFSSTSSTSPVNYIHTHLPSSVFHTATSAYELVCLRLRIHYCWSLSHLLTFACSQHKYEKKPALTRA